MRKGRCFFASKKVLWRNRHAIVLGSSNFYRKFSYDDKSYYQKDNTEYVVVEPPESSREAQVPTAGPEFSSDKAGDGPVKQNSACSREKQEINDECKDCTRTVDQILEENMMNISADLIGRELLKLFKQLDDREGIDDLK